MKRVDQTVTIELNGESRSLPMSMSVRQLLHHLGISPDRIAVELNRRIIRRADWDRTSVQQHDKVEIVQFVGGG
jgi:sulfur carrier protein